MKVLIPETYQKLINAEESYIWIDGGRVGGKTNNTALIAIAKMLQNPYNDIVVARVSYGSLGDSSYAELENALAQFGDYADDFVLKKSPLRIERKGDAGTIYFIGYGGSNTSRTKSIRTKHPVIMVILEETQELKSKRNLDEALASLRRRFSEDAKVCVLGNPPPMEAHWFNVEREKLKNDPDWLVLRVTWQDVVMFINDFDLKEIIKTKYSDPEYYNWFYMGESTGGFGSVYPMFRKERHIITPQQFERALSRGHLKILGCVIGGDGAVNRDCTAFTPYILLNNGQAVIGPIFYHNPKDDGVIGFHQLVQDYLTRWFEEICRRFRLGSPLEIREHNNVRQLPIWMIIDSAAPDLIAECRFFLGDRCTSIQPIKKGTVMEMVGVMQSAIANDNIIVIDYGGYFDYRLNKFVNHQNLLAEQLSLLIWNEKQNGYDPIVPNDVSDSATYGGYWWYSNQDNIQYFNIMKANNIQNLTIRDILNSKEN